MLNTNATMCRCLTLQEVGEVVERAVVRVAVPFLQSHSVEGLEAERLPLAIHHDHLTGVTVQTRHVLRNDSQTTVSVDFSPHSSDNKNEEQEHMTLTATASGSKHTCV